MEKKTNTDNLSEKINEMLLSGFRITGLEITATENDSLKINDEPLFIKYKDEAEYQIIIRKIK